MGPAICPGGRAAALRAIASGRRDSLRDRVRLVHPGGKRRLHEKPNAREIAACKPWLAAELAALQPRVVVCLGATAAQTLLGRSFRVTQHRGEFIQSPLAPIVLATVHPSSLLRAPDSETRHRETERFIDDLRLVARAMSQRHPQSET